MNTGSFLILLAAGCIIILAYRKYKKTKTALNHTVSFYVGYDDDTQEQTDWSESQSTSQFCPCPVSARVKIRYTDSKGKSSDRIVDVKECDTSASDGYLIGFCHMRRSIRTFRIDRIDSAIDLDTGELIKSITDFASKKYEDSPVSAVDKLFEAHSDALRVLFYIAKADGKFTAKEKDIYLDYCRSVYPDDRLNTQVIDSALKWVDIPSTHTYKVICGKLAKLDATTKGSILEAAESIISTQKSVSSEEELALNYMKKRFAAGK